MALELLLKCDFFVPLKFFEHLKDFGTVAKPMTGGILQQKISWKKQEFKLKKLKVIIANFLSKITIDSKF